MRLRALRRLPFALGWLTMRPIERRAEDSYILPVTRMLILELSYAMMDAHNMTGPALGGATSGPRFGYAAKIPEAEGSLLLGLIQTIHSEPTASAFARLLRKDLREEDDYVQLAHLFEEVSVLALHRLIREELLFDAFAFDMYWDELREDVARLRKVTGNDKFCENFEIAAERARKYRDDRPPKLRWEKRPAPGNEPPGRPPGGPDRSPVPRGGGPSAVREPAER